MILFNFMYFLFLIHLKSVLSTLLNTFQKATRLVTKATFAAEHSAGSREVTNLNFNMRQADNTSLGMRVNSSSLLEQSFV